MLHIEPATQFDSSDDVEEGILFAKGARAPIILDRDAWEDAIEDAALERDMLCQWELRSSMPFSMD